MNGEIRDLNMKVRKANKMDRITRYVQRAGFGQVGFLSFFFHEIGPQQCALCRPTVTMKTQHVSLVYKIIGASRFQIFCRNCIMLSPLIHLVWASMQ
jgi:hypothetical protein